MIQFQRKERNHRPPLVLPGGASPASQTKTVGLAEPAFQSKGVTGSTKGTIIIIILLFLERIQETLDLTAFR